MDRLWARRKKIDLKPLKRTITLMAVNNEFLKAITPLFTDTAYLPKADHLLTIVHWIIRYGNKYNRAPREYLDKFFQKYQQEIRILVLPIRTRRQV